MTFLPETQTTKIEGRGRGEEDTTGLMGGSSMRDNYIARKLLEHFGALRGAPSPTSMELSVGPVTLQWQTGMLIGDIGA